MKKRNLLFRLEQLEARTQAREPSIFRYGWVTRLPEDFTGERHTVIVMRQATGSSNTEWCHFEERPGPALPGSEDDSLTITNLSQPY